MKKNEFHPGDKAMAKATLQLALANNSVFDSLLKSAAAQAAQTL